MSAQRNIVREVHYPRHCHDDSSPCHHTNKGTSGTTTVGEHHVHKRDWSPLLPSSFRIIHIYTPLPLRLYNFKQVLKLSISRNEQSTPINQSEQSILTINPTMSRTTTHSRLTASSLNNLDTQSASHSSRYSGSSMVSPKGTRYSHGSRTSSRVSALRPEDSVSSISSRSASSTRSAAPGQIEDRHPTISHRSGSRIPDSRSMYATRSIGPSDYRDDDFYDEPYAPPSHSTASCYSGSQVSRSRSAARNLPYNVEERAPSDYEPFQKIGYTGDIPGCYDAAGGYRLPTAWAEYEAMHPRVPASNRSGAPSSRVGEYRAIDGGASCLSSRQGGYARSTYSASSRSSNRERALVRIPNIYER